MQDDDLGEVRDVGAEPDEVEGSAVQQQRERVPVLLHRPQVVHRSAVERDRAPLVVPVRQRATEVEEERATRDGDQCEQEVDAADARIAVIAFGRGGRRHRRIIGDPPATTDRLRSARAPSTSGRDCAAEEVDDLARRRARAEHRRDTLRLELVRVVGRDRAADDDEHVLGPVRA